MSFEGRTIVVFGAASGMGRATTLMLAERGASVFAADIDEKSLDEVCSDSGATARPCDVRDSTAVSGLLNEVGGNGQPLHGVANFAGVLKRTGILECSDEDFDFVMAVNARGTFNVCRAAARVLQTQGFGSIVNVSSIWSEVGATGALAYCASKGAVSQITRAAALDLAGSGVRVNEVRPGETNTPMLASERGKTLTAGEIQEKLDDIAQGIPEGRLAEPSEIAAAALFLLSDESSYLQGTSITVDGAYTAC